MSEYTPRFCQLCGGNKIDRQNEHGTMCEKCMVQGVESLIRMAPLFKAWLDKALAPQTRQPAESGPETVEHISSYGGRSIVEDRKIT